LRLSLRAKEGLAIAALVGLAVAVATALHLVTVARLGMDEATGTGALLAHQLFLQGSRALVGARGVPAEVLRRDPGMRALLDSMVGYSPTVVYAAITDPQGRALVHSNPAEVRRHLPPRERLDAVARRGPLALIRTLSGPPQIFEAQVPLTLGGRPFGTARVGISTSLLRRQLEGAVRQSLLMAGVAFALALGAGLTLGGMALRPLRQIAAGVERLARGEEHEPLAVDRGDELGELAAKLNLLGAQVHEHRSQLLGEKARLEQMVRVLQDAILFLNRDGQLVFANPAAEGFLGRPLVEAVGRRLKDLLAADHPLVSALDALLAPGGPAASHHLRLEAPGGAVREVRVSAYPVREDGQFAGAVVAIQDLEAVKAVHSLVDYSVRLADLGRLTSGVAHEVKNPLNAMTIHLELLRGNLPPDSAEARESLEVIGKEIRRLDRVVQGFLKFVRPQELHLQRVDVTALFQDVAGLVEVEATQAGVRLETVVAPRTDATMADADLLRQALVNLVQNAIQAMPDGGAVTLRAAPGLEGQLELAVEDQGVGIPEEDQDKVFRLYYTTRPDGNGIGLALVYRAVQMHGGTVCLRSAVGRGTTVTITLPHLAAHPAEAAP
jgi:PAS domain S-box-containing protein